MDRNVHTKPSCWWAAKEIFCYPTQHQHLKLSSLILSRKSCFVGVYIQQSIYRRNRNEQGAFNHASSLSQCSTTSFGCRTLFAMETLICATPTLQEVWWETRVQGAHGDIFAHTHFLKELLFRRAALRLPFRAGITEQNNKTNEFFWPDWSKLFCTDSGVYQMMHLLLQRKLETQVCKQ